MPLSIYDPRVLAIDLRFRRYGFAIFEGPRRLLDFGTIAFPARRVEYARYRFLDLLRLSLPAVIVVKRERWDTIAAHRQAESLVVVLAEESESRRIQIRLLAQDAVISTFRNLGCETKAEISSALARIFPELVWQLPPEEKAWKSEHPRQSAFDAIALGLAYWQQETRAVTDSLSQMRIQEEDI